MPIELPAIPRQYQTEFAASVSSVNPNNMLTLADPIDEPTLFNREVKLRIGESTDDAGSIEVITCFGEEALISNVKTGEYLPGPIRGIAGVTNVAKITVFYDGPDSPVYVAP